MSKKVLLLALLMLLLLGVFSACAAGPVALNVGRVVIFESSSAAYTADDNSAYDLQGFIEATFSALPEGSAIVAAADGSTETVAGADILSCSLLPGENGIVLSGDKAPKALAEKELLYIAFSEEALLFVESELTLPQVTEMLGMPLDGPYTFSASDGFNWASLDEEDSQASVLQPNENGSVDVSVPSLPEHGLVRDCIYFVPGHTPGAASAMVK